MRYSAYPMKFHVSYLKQFWTKTIFVEIWRKIIYNNVIFAIIWGSHSGDKEVSSLARCSFVSLWYIKVLQSSQKWVPGTFPGGKGGRCIRLTTLPPSCAAVTKSGILNFLEPSGSVQACNGTALPFTLLLQSSLPLKPKIEGARISHSVYWLHFVLDVTSFESRYKPNTFLLSKNVPTCSGAAPSRIL